MPIRVIPCLDIQAGRVVKGVNFVGLKDAGDPIELARHYSQAGADQLMFLDISATTEQRAASRELISQTAHAIDIPLGVGGGINSVAAAVATVTAGASTVSMNSAAVADPQLVTAVAAELGSSRVTVAIDVSPASSCASGYEVTVQGGQHRTGLDAVQWSQQAAELGAGEILLTAMDADGTHDGFNLDILGAVCHAVTIPVVASGGAGTLEHFVAAAQAGASGVLAASVFHFGQLTISDVKTALSAAGFMVSGK